MATQGVAMALSVNRFSRQKLFRLRTDTLRAATSPYVSEAVHGIPGSPLTDSLLIISPFGANRPDDSAKQVRNVHRLGTIPAITAAGGRCFPGFPLVSGQRAPLAAGPALAFEPKLYDV